MCRTGTAAKTISNQFNAEYATTDFEKIVNDNTVDAVLISTPHHLHAEMALKSLKQGKHVLLEKPMAMSQSELDGYKEFYQNSNPSSPMVLTGFNRRFSPIMRKVKKLVKDRVNPMIINYRMNAGYIPLDHWIQGKEGGGRNIGEACHIYDLFTFLTEAKFTQVNTQAIKVTTKHYTEKDNFVVVISFADGSVCNLIYTSLGSTQFPKEHMEIYFDGKVIVMTDYKSLVCKGLNQKDLNLTKIDKGHEQELKAFGQFVKNGGEWPISFWEQVQATEISFSVEKQLV
ncbi:hypothetical protein BVY03_00755 [bacterium K02(2017)]|nr:hypothetical protein BVY03_00755 [bacterium K02(2017)]